MISLAILSLVYVAGILLLIRSVRRSVKSRLGYLPGILILGFVLLGVVPAILIRQGVIVESAQNVLVAIIYFASFVIVAPYILAKKQVEANKRG